MANNLLIEAQFLSRGDVIAIDGYTMTVENVHYMKETQAGAFVSISGLVRGMGPNFFFAEDTQGIELLESEVV